MTVTTVEISPLTVGGISGAAPLSASATPAKKTMRKDGECG